MTPLAPYDPTARCPKCGHGVIGTRHRPGNDPFAALNVAFGVRIAIGEHMRRWCQRCLHAWAEAPLDRPDNLAAANADGAAEPVVHEETDPQLSGTPSLWVRLTQATTLVDITQAVRKACPDAIAVNHDPHHWLQFEGETPFADQNPGALWCPGHRDVRIHEVTL